MKKVMFALMCAFSAMTATAATCTPDEVVTPDVTLVYKVRVKLTTTKGLNKTSTYTEGGSVCAPGETVTSQNVMREVDKTVIEGWIYDCVSTCNTIESGSIVLWDVKRKVQILDPAIASEFLNVIGKKKNKAEWCWALTGTTDFGPASQELTLNCAGTGTFSVKKGYFDTISGTCCGMMSAPYDTSSKHPTCEPSQVWKCSDLASMTDENTVAYGTWTVRLNKTASARYAKNGKLECPKYVTIQ